MNHYRCNMVDDTGRVRTGYEQTVNADSQADAVAIYRAWLEEGNIDPEADAMYLVADEITSIYRVENAALCVELIVCAQQGGANIPANAAVYHVCALDDIYAVADVCDFVFVERGAGLVSLGDKGKIIEAIGAVE